METFCNCASHRFKYFHTHSQHAHPISCMKPSSGQNRALLLTLWLLVVDLMSFIIPIPEEQTKVQVLLPQGTPGHLICFYYAAPTGLQAWWIE